MRERDILWAPAAGIGLEHLQLSQDAEGYYANSVLISMKYGQPFRAWYGIRCDQNWRVRSVDVQLLQGGDEELGLRADGVGHWRSSSGEPLPQLDGCIDVDITATPFTNTIPIRRLALTPGQSAEVFVAYIALPELGVSPVRQRYTCLETSEYGGLYKYEGLSTGFTANIRVDADGLVIDYPGLFKRV
jgi:hypothetical protein